MAEMLRGKVARILNSREIAINLGSKQGVTVGMCFDIMAPSEEIVDPETNETLGSIERPKVRVRVVAVQEKLSVASTYKTKTVNIGGADIGSFASAFMAPRWETRHETLKTVEKTWEDLDERESYVNTGDPVVQVLEEESTQT